MAQESVKKVQQIEDLLEGLHRKLNSNLDKIEKIADDAKRQKRYDIIKQQRTKYRKRKHESINLEHKIKNYEERYKANKDEINNILKPLRKQIKTVESKRNGIRKIIGTRLKQIKQFTTENKLPKIDNKSLQKSINDEKELYQRILKIIENRDLDSSWKGIIANNKRGTKRSYQDLDEGLSDSTDSNLTDSDHSEDLNEALDNSEDIKEISDLDNIEDPDYVDDSDYDEDLAEPICISDDSMSSGDITP